MVQTAGLCRGQVSKENQVFDKRVWGGGSVATVDTRDETPYFSVIHFFLLKVFRTGQFCPHHLTFVICHR